MHFLIGPTVWLCVLSTTSALTCVMLMFCVKEADWDMMAFVAYFAISTTVCTPNVQGHEVPNLGTSPRHYLNSVPIEEKWGEMGIGLGFFFTIYVETWGKHGVKTPKKATFV